METWTLVPWYGRLSSMPHFEAGEHRRMVRSVLCYWGKSLTVWWYHQSVLCLWSLSEWTPTECFDYPHLRDAGHKSSLGLRMKPRAISMKVSHSLIPRRGLDLSL